MPKPRTADDDSVRLLLDYRPPFPWQHLLGFLAARAIPGVEYVGDGAYIRTLRIRDHAGWFRVRHEPRDSAVSLEAP
jgi:AraC family transcriptional regulator, regulatory protein of adaptative response / DNA-3-methyladenine glycosylase II